MSLATDPCEWYTFEARYPNSLLFEQGRRGLLELADTADTGQRQGARDSSPVRTGQTKIFGLGICGIDR